MKLKLADDLSLPIDAVTQTFLVVGKRGSGKSNTAARLVEQFHRARLPFVVLDPTDTWWGLKAGQDGGRGLDVYVFGGRKADLPLEAGGGALIAEVLCEHRLSMVLSVKHLSGRERSAFMVAFAQTLFQKWVGGPLHVVLEEAHELAPQMSGGRGAGNQDNEAAMLGAFKRLWKLGRASGIGGTAVTQRPASLSKDITTQSEILIAHRTIGPQDVKAIGEWIKYHGEQLEVLGDLPSLPTGQAIVWAPEFPEGQPLGLVRATVLRRETYDSASTPKVGEQRVEPKELAPVDLERLRTKMAATIEKAKADDPRELRKTLAEKDRRIKELEKATAGFSPSNERAKQEVPVLTDADRSKLSELVSVLTALRKDVAEIEEHGIDRLAQKLHDLVNSAHAAEQLALRSKVDFAVERLERSSLQKILDKLAAVTPHPHTHAMTQRVEPAARSVAGPSPLRADRPHTPHGSDRGGRPSARTARPAVGATADGVTPVMQRILNALGELEQLGAREPERELVAFLAGYSHLQSKGFVNAMSALRTAGLIEYGGPGTVMLTDDGRQIAAPPERPRSPRELQDRIIGMLGGASGRILEPLLEAYPHAMPRADVAAMAGYGHLQSKGFVNAISRLRTLGFVDYPDRGSIIAKPVLFLEA